MKKMLALLATMAMLLGLSTVVWASGEIDQAQWDASIFEIPADLHEDHEDMRDNYFGVECVDSIRLGIDHFYRGRISFYKWLDKFEKIPEVTQDYGGCFSMESIAPLFVVFWNGVPNLSKNLFKWAEGKTKDVYIPDSVTEIDEDCFVKGSHITLHFTKNNAVALAYAQTRGMNYEIVPEPTSDKAVLDTTIFFEDVEEIAACVCPEELGAYHMFKDGMTFFKWAGKMDKMPADGHFCGTPESPRRETVIFLDGVPNLVKDLFKYWENGTNDVYIPDTVTEIDEDAFVMGSHITLHFTKNNAVALAYAQTRGMNYEIVPEPTSDKVVLDTTIFFEEPEIECDCACPIFLGVHHMLKDGMTFFKWAGKMDKMPADGNFCGTPEDLRRETVIFLDGVPNLVKDLFKYWENGTNDVYIPDSVTEIAEDCFVKGSHITLHFTKNNAVALAYANARGMAFEVMDGERVPFDVDFDKSVDMKDVLSLRKSIARLPAAVEIYSIDLNADGSVDMKDVLTLRKQIATAAA